jgi:hypothetical protein
LKSVTAQLFIKYGRFKELTDLYTKTQPFRPPQNELLTTLVAVATYPSPEVPGQLLDVESEEQKQSSHTITIIIDGLDEVPIRNRDQYFLIFDTVAKLKAPQFRMVVVSRFQTPIKNRFTETSGWTSTSRTPQDVEADIELYNRQQISRDKCLRDLSDPIKQSIRDRLGQGKPGMSADSISTPQSPVFTDIF